MKFAASIGLTLISIAVGSTGVLAQSAKDLVGTWEHVATVNTASDGKKSESFGTKPKGMAIFTADGHFTVINLRPDVAKFAANNRLRGTDAENKAAVQGAVALYGTYSATDKVINLKVQGSTYPNWNDTDQKRDVVTLNSDELKWKVAASSSGESESTWKRLK